MGKHDKKNTKKSQNGTNNFKNETSSESDLSEKEKKTDDQILNDEKYILKSKILNFV